MTTEQSLDFVRRQKEQEKERHNREKLALEQRNTAENQKYQNNIQRLKMQKQNLLNSLKTTSNEEFLSYLSKLDRLNKQLQEILEA